MLGAASRHALEQNWRVVLLARLNDRYNSFPQVWQLSILPLLRTHLVGTEVPITAHLPFVSRKSGTRTNPRGGEASCDGERWGRESLPRPSPRDVVST